jgi:hypothetical protein
MMVHRNMKLSFGVSYIYQGIGKESPCRNEFE